MQPIDGKLALREQLMNLGISEPATHERLLALARYSEVEKDACVIKAGQLPTHFYVLLSGLARYYYSTPSGKEWNKAFFHEGQLVGSLSSFLKKQPCAYTIAALERCQLAALPLSIFDEHHGLGEQLQMLLNRYIREIMLRNEEREAMLLTLNSEARYLWLLEHQAWLARRVPQYHLASYLGIEPASLSRIKKQIPLSAQQ
ncbi:Crp/Fnr family transcriptional regulator [Pseudomonas sp. ML96]|uniref:Crp/Fnr family transcriptional regulator n=1 Tax=Pseudomonas sp. ML96 TaxID=1523503 RepID=UPI0005B8E99A|nr:Crp/Fnr family transcriptional regulator [Pseudomonas sp. ML96]